MNMYLMTINFSLDSLIDVTILVLPVVTCSVS